MRNKNEDIGKKEVSPKIKARILLFVNLIVYSFVGVLFKKAGTYPPASLYLFVFYGTALFLLAVYALLWQQVLKRLPLSEAFACKAVTVVLGMLWGWLFFSEAISLNKIIGGVVIVVGVIIAVIDTGTEAKGQETKGTVRHEE